MRRRVVALASAVILGVTGVGAGEAASTESPTGRQAVVLPTENGRPVGDLGEYSFELQRVDAPEEVSSFPCGAPFSLPEGTFLGWAEGPGRISLPILLRNGPGGPQSVPPRRFLVELRRAGSVVVDPAGLRPPSGGEDDLQLRLLQMEPIVNGKLQPELVRWWPWAAASVSHQMPEGPVAVAVFDTAAGRYVGLSRLVRAEANTPVTARPTAPAGDRAALVVRLKRHRMVVDPKQDDIAVLLTRPDGTTAPPDALARTPLRLYAFWYDLAPGSATLKVTSASSWAADEPVDLEGGRIADAEVELQEPATLHASLVLPDDFPVEKAAVSVQAENGGEVYRSIDLEPRFPAQLSLEGLPRLPVEVALDAGPWRFTEPADLRPGEASVLVAPDLVHVSGRVTVAGEGTPAEVRFLTLKSSSENEIVSSYATDEDGHYEATLPPGQVQPVMHVSVDGREPVWWTIEPPLRDGDVIDVDLEGRAVDVQVEDAETSEGIAGATVWYGWAGARSGGRPATTDGDGVVRLPPSPEPEVMLGVRADGYRRASRKLDLEHLAEDTVIVPLEPEKEGRTVRLLLPGGEPAAAAEVAVLVPGGASLRWTGRADAEGTVMVPDTRPGELLAVRHPGAGVLLADAGTAAVADEAALTMPPSGGPLSIRVVEPSGEPVPFALVTLWVSGYRLSGPTLGWLLRAPPVALQDGSWSAEGLPAAPIQVLFVKRTGDGGALTATAAGAYDYRRAPVAFPWSNVIEMEAVLP